MNRVVLLSWSAITVLHTSSGSISGLCGNSITLPLPNLVAKLAKLLLCGRYSAIRTKVYFSFFFFCKSTAHPVHPLHSSVCFWHLSCRHIFTCLVTAYAKGTSATRCSLPVHRLSSIDLILFCVCVYHSACQPKPWDMTVVLKEFWNGQTLSPLLKYSCARCRDRSPCYSCVVGLLGALLASECRAV